jgi:Mn-dependent DtxR family transcriptional regulator
MQDREPPTPAAAKVLAAVRRLVKAGKTATHGELCRKLGKGKNTIAEAIGRLERGGWVVRADFRPGVPRPIRLCELRSEDVR